MTELVTPPLDDIILPGITRDSVMAIAREHASNVNPISGLPDKLVVSERPITMGEVRQAAKDGTLLEVFGCGAYTCPSTLPAFYFFAAAVVLIRSDVSLFLSLRSGNISINAETGTAAIVCPVKRIGYRGDDITIPVGEDGLGPLTKAILNEISGRQVGIIPSDWSVVVVPQS